MREIKDMIDYLLYIGQVETLSNGNEDFYSRPKSKTLSFENSPVRIKTLNSILPNLCKAAGIKRKTVHCLRVTCLSKLFNSGVEKELIRERTKHRSNANMPMRKQVRRKFLRYQPYQERKRRQKKMKKIKVQQIRRKELKGFSFLNVSSFTNCDVTFLSRKKNELAVWLINYDG